MRSNSFEVLIKITRRLLVVCSTFGPHRDISSISIAMLLSWTSSVTIVLVIASVLAASASEDKRAWSDLNGAWGKRNWDQLRGVWGKRGAGQLPNSVWGKREDAPSDWNAFRGSWGKRNNWNKLQGVWGKRDSSDWNKLQGLWGKRASWTHSTDEDESSSSK
uniref:Prothoracicostatic peptide n=1 Tax=Strigamia maritima TaxID=126957 RepID=T1J122_STRMM